jgi:Protein of unknown function (DUF2905)
MVGMGKLLLVTGAVLVVIGIVILLLQKSSFSGKLPGDIIIKHEQFTFYFPLTTSIMISIIVSLILYLIGKFR